jgi:hypothetical protein
VGRDVFAVDRLLALGEVGPFDRDFVCLAGYLDGDGIALGHRRRRLCERFETVRDTCV